MQRVPETIDDPLWEQADYLDLPMGGQVIFEPREFTPVITNVRVRGYYDNDRVAIMLEWVDKKPNTGDDDMPPDGIRIQFPEKLTGGTEKPYFFMGDKRHPVNLWWWNAATNTAEEYTAKGKDKLERQQSQDIKSNGLYKEGLYRVVFTRKLKTDDKKDIVFEPGRFIPFSVAAFDGRQEEEGIRCALSAWYYMMLEPGTPVKVYVMPPLVVIVVFGIGLGLHRRLSKKNET